MDVAKIMKEVNLFEILPKRFLQLDLSDLLLLFRVPIQQRFVAHSRHTHVLHV